MLRTVNRSTVEIDCSSVHRTNVPYELARQIRASYYFIGALLSASAPRRCPCPAAVIWARGPLTCI